MPYVLGTSTCEITHDPVTLLIPINLSNVNNFCPVFSSSSTEAGILAHAVISTPVGFIPSGTYCIPVNKTILSYLQATMPVSTNPLTTFQNEYNETINLLFDSAPIKLIQNKSLISASINLTYTNGTKTNAVLSLNSQFYEGLMPIQNLSTYGIPNETYLSFILLYRPGPNGTVSAPTEFYNSNYYMAFYLGVLPGFKPVYPSSNLSGINYVDRIDPIVIFQMDNYTGGIPKVTPKPPWVHNNYTMPG